MIIGIDGNEANVEKPVGVSVYTKNLLYWFSQWANNNTQFKVYLKQRPLKSLPKENKYYQYITINGKFLWSQLFLPLELYLKNKVDLFFSPAHYSPRFCPVPQVVTIHDLSYFYYPNEFLKKDLYQLMNWTKYSVNKATKIIAVSKTTKKDLMKWYHLPEDRIEVIYNGFEKNVNRRTAAVLGKENHYILFVGTLQPRKNLHVLIDAFNRLIKIRPEFSLVIAGKTGWLYEDIFQKVKNLGIEKKVIFTGHVPDEELTWLYKNAFCLVMHSFYEGFGIPILEAMANGCPVISSFTSSLPEVGGDACLYFDPQNPADLLDKLNQLINNDNLRKELIEKGRERIKLFSWKKSAEQTLKVIKDVCQA